MSDRRHAGTNAGSGADSDAGSEAGAEELPDSFAGGESFVTGAADPTRRVRLRAAGAAGGSGAFPGRVARPRRLDGGFLPAVLGPSGGRRAPARAGATLSPESDPRTASAVASRGAGWNTTRLPSRMRFTSPARSSACRWRVVHDCDSRTAAASWLTLRSARASSRSSSSNRRGGASTAIAPWNRVASRSIAWPCIPCRGD